MMTITGVIRGIVPVTDKYGTRHFLGVECSKDNGFPGETITHRLLVPKDRVEEMKSVYNPHVDRVVAVPFFAKARGKKNDPNGTGYLNLILNGPPVEQSQQLKKAS